MANVDTILSKIEIQDITVRHFWAMDDGDVDAYLATWTSNGKLFLDDQAVIEGHENLRRYFADVSVAKAQWRVVTNFQYPRTNQRAGSSAVLPHGVLSTHHPACLGAVRRPTGTPGRWLEVCSAHATVSVNSRGIDDRFPFIASKCHLGVTASAP